MLVFLLVKVQRNKVLPIYKQPKKGYSGEEIAQMLCNPMLDDKPICCIHPTSNVCFAADLSTQKDHNDICADDLGAWNALHRVC